MSPKGVDLTGQRFERLVVLAAAPSRMKPNGKYQRYWRCRCDCGAEIEVPTGNLQYGNTKSCGCLRKEQAPNRKGLTGQTFGSLTALRPAPSRKQYGTTVGYWRCRCICGTELEVQTGNLLSGNSKSCGCGDLERKLGNTYAQSHGHCTGDYRSPTWISWWSMRRRCRERAGYADRGITVDPRWEDFEAFLADMGERPKGHTLDRIDNDGPYSPSNCRWATGKTQGNNRRNNRFITYQGRTQTIAEWAREVGLSRNMLYNRIVLYNWPVDRAMKP